MLHIELHWHYCKIKTKITLFSNALIQLKNIHGKAVSLTINCKSQRLILKGIVIQICNVLSSILYDSTIYKVFF